MLRLPLSLLLPVLALGPVLAQAAGGKLDEIVVTATKDPRVLSDMAVAVTVLDREEIATVQPVHPNQVFQRVPGAWISRGNGQESLTALRSPVLTGPGSCGAFFMAADGVSLRAPGFCNVNQLFDANVEQADRIEVLKGPGTALYGSGAMHGVINILTPAPATERQQVAAVETGPNNYLRGRYRFSDTLGDHGLMLAGNLARDGGYKKSAGFEQGKINLRHTFNGEQMQVDSILRATMLRQDTAGFITGFEAYKDGDRKQENPNPEAYRDADAVTLQSTLSLSLDSFSTLSLTPFYRHNEMTFLQHFFPWQPVEENGHSSVGMSARYYREGSWLDIIAVVDVDATEGYLKETQDAPFSLNQPAGVHYDYRVDARQWAPWLQLQWALAPQWQLSAGIRYEQTDYDYDNRTGDGPACTPQASACRFFRPADRRDSFDNLSLNAGLVWDWHPSHSTYWRLSRGLRAPQTAELYRLQGNQSQARLESEALDSIEWGLRGSHRDLNYDFGFYGMRKRDVIFQDPDRRNVSGARTLHYGVDFSLRWQLSRTLGLALDGTLARHEYDSDTALLGSSGDINGNLIDTAPEHFGSLRLDWRITGALRAELEWAHLGEYFLDPDNLHRYDGHDLLNLRLQHAFSDNLNLALRVTNLSDEDYAERADFGFGSYRYFVGEPSSLFLELRYSAAP
ncbi:MAG: TonB-dependent receptor [Halieaceae bacterium]|jgi:outer membrane receptor protein involved in Fe transport|nr:TonB-dependent receptor [Halieaceae bacterium]